MPFRILIADDEIYDKGNEISELPELLRMAGYEVKTTSDTMQAGDLVWEYQPDLIVLDIHFPDEPKYGIELCEAVRRGGNETPIILVTAVRKETEMVLAGFEAGADDYVKRPQGNLELMARIRANLPPEVIVVNDYMQVDLAGHRVWLRKNGDWQHVHLAPRLWELLEVLVINAELIVPTTSIKDRVWGKSVSDGALQVAIHRLRKKLEPDPSHPVYVEAISTFGYRFNGRPVRASSVPPTGQMHVSPGAKPTHAPERRAEAQPTAEDEADLKARLMVHAEAAIDRLLTGKREWVDLQPSDIERLVRAAGQYVVERFTSELVVE